jgi:WD40 repeat protein
VEVYAPTESSTDEGISQLQLVTSNPHMVYFTTLKGRFGMHDMRSPPKESPATRIFQLSEKKIGGFSVHPGHPHLLATASLDRTLKLWDLRKITGKGDEKMPNLVGEHESRLSVSNAMFNYAGQVATASYDDTVKIYDFGAMASQPVGTELSADEMNPSAVVRHNNQTGRWVTM